MRLEKTEQEKWFESGKGFFSTTLLTRVARGFTAVVQPVDKWSRLPPSVQLNACPKAMRKGRTSAENEEPRIN